MKILAMVFLVLVMLWLLGYITNAILDVIYPDDNEDEYSPPEVPPDKKP